MLRMMCLGPLEHKEAGMRATGESREGAREGEKREKERGKSSLNSSECG